MKIDEKMDENARETRLFSSFVEMIAWTISDTYADCQMEEFDRALDAMSAEGDEETALVRWSHELASLIFR